MRQTTRARIYANAVRDIVRRRTPLPTDSTVAESNSKRLYDILEQYESDVVFTHVGLSDIKTAFQTNPYDFLIETLEDHFESILAPGYTPQFRSVGLYDKQTSEPAYGMWPKLFFQDAQYRTDDAIHSILVRGDYRFEDCNHHDTFAQDGCFGQLDQDNVLIMNIGTPYLICTHNYYVERQNNVPYYTSRTYEGTLVCEDDTSERIQQRDRSTTVFTKQAWKKIQTAGVEHGVIDRHDLNGLLILAFKAREYHEFLREKLRNNPYFMVTF